jgi:DNA modification methylase
MMSAEIVAISLPAVSQAAPGRKGEAALYGTDLFGDAIRPDPRGVLAESFVMPPFSVLSARDGEWQERKRRWLTLGIRSEVGRGDALTYNISQFDAFLVKEGTRASSDEQATSVFDPTLCELAYRWFAPSGGRVIDPFAGGSVRGIVAATLGLHYVGVELRREQVEANEAQAADICRDLVNPPRYVCGDSRKIDALATGAYDFLFTCPPYGDLEVYSDDPRDLSTLGPDDFDSAYAEVIAKSCALLRDDRFACVVVGDYRDKRGNYRNFVGKTIDAFLRAGLHLYNEAILVTPAGSLPVRTKKQFDTSRKMGKTHQNILVFVKGDGKRAGAACNGEA